MCFPNAKKSDLCAKYDEEGTIIEENSHETDIPEDISEHVDNVFLNRDLYNGILAFIYETKDQLIVVWTSDEAIALCQEMSFI